MSAVLSCPKCGARLPENAPGGLCPSCLLQAGFELRSVSQTSAAARFVPPQPRELAARFPQLEILELVGQGGMGAVYKARQIGLDRLVALKILPPEVAADPNFAERFAREARALARLSHQNIVSVYDFGQSDSQFYFIMEFVEGANLRQVIQAGGLTAEAALAIVPQICTALQFAHNEGIVHRDIKPENILVDKQGRVKIADFGLAKLFRGPADATLTGTHQAMGTVHYMAPEQIRAASAVDHRADIYSLGVVFYEMLTGQLPIGRFPPPSQQVRLDVRLDEIVLRTLESEPARSYQHASEVQYDVETVTGAARPSYAKPNRAPPTASPQTGSTPRAAEAWPIRTIGLALCGLLGTFLPWVYDRSDVTAWNTQLSAQGTNIPNWTLAIAALAVAVLLMLRGMGQYLGYALIPTLGLYGLVHSFVVGLQFVDQGRYPGVGLYVCLAAFGIVLIAELFRPFLDDQRRTAPRPVLATGPQYSRKAIIGFCWAPFLFLALMLTFMVSTLGPVPEHVDSGASMVNAAPNRTLWQWALMFTVLPLGVTAPFGTTILGVIAIGDIRHSRGKLVGLPLAVTDALLFPLLCLDAIIVGLFGLICYYGLQSYAAGATQEPAISSLGFVVLLLSLPVCVAVDSWIIRGVWRSATAPIAK